MSYIRWPLYSVFLKESSGNFFVPGLELPLAIYHDLHDRQKVVS